jgi:hypothetical protein
MTLLYLALIIITNEHQESFMHFMEKQRENGPRCPRKETIVEGMTSFGQYKKTSKDFQPFDECETCGESPVKMATCNLIYYLYFERNYHYNIVAPTVEFE